MAHGFLTPTEVSGDRFWENVKDIGKLFKRLSKLFKKDLRVINTNVKEVRELITGKDQGSLPPGSSNKALPPGSGGLAKRGGTFSSLANISPVNGGGGLNSDTFFKQAQTGVGPSGEYLTKSQRREAFIKSRQEAVKTSSAVRQAPNITPDGNSDVVSAVNRNTEAISTLIKVTEKQTSTQVQLSTKSDQKAEKMLSRSRARAEEKDIEKGKDLSGFLTPIKAAAEKEKKQGSGGDGLFDFLDLGLDVLDLFDGGGKKRRGRRGKPRASGRNRMPRKPSSPRRGLPKPKLPKFGGGPKGGLPKPKLPKFGGGPKGKLPGLPKGVGPKGGLLSLLFAGMEFSDRKSSGQSNLQAGLGTAASVAGGLAGAKGGAAAGAAIGALFGGVGAVPGALIGGLLGGLGGSMLAGGAADMATGAFSNGGIISKPILSLMGEGSKAEGVFPLEGTKGKKTFEMFGKGILEAQKSKKDEFAKIQAAGLKFYFQNQEGFKFFGDVLKTLFAPLLAPLEVLKNVGGGLLNALIGGGANAATLSPGGSLVDPTISGDEEEYLMRLMIAEAGGEGEVGMAAVGRSVLNRAGLIQSGEVRPGMFNAKSGSIMDVINASGQYQPVREGKLKRDLTSEERARAKKALDMARNQAALRSSLEAQGMSSGEVNKIMASTGFRTKDAFYDASQEVNVATLGAHRFNTAGNAKMLTPGAKINAGVSGGSAGVLAKTAESLKGFSTRVKETDYGKNGCVYAVNKVFNAAGITPPWGSSLYVPDADKAMQKAGWQQVPYSQAQPGDVMVMKDRKSPPQAHIGIMQTNGKVLSNSSGDAAMTWEGTIDYYNNYYGGQGVLYRMPSTSMATASNPPPSNNPPSELQTRHLGKGARKRGVNARKNTNISATPTGQYNIPGAPQLSSALNAANPNTGTSMMATSAQVAMAGITQSGAAPTIINNNYYGMGGQQGQVNPNGVSTGIGMGDTGTSIFQDLRIRSLG